MYIPPIVLGKGSVKRISPLVARQRLGQNVAAAKNTYAAIEELLDVSFSMLSASYQRKAGN
jgi:hypothetical protein